MFGYRDETLSLVFDILLIDISESYEDQDGNGLRFSSPHFLSESTLRRFAERSFELCTGRFTENYDSKCKCVSLNSQSYCNLCQVYFP